MKTTLVATSSTKQEGGKQIVWETHRVHLVKDDVYGMGISISGGEDQPVFANGDPAIAVSDVIPRGPAEGKLMINDRIEEVNGISLEGATHSGAISILQDCGNTVDLIIKRKILLSRNEAFDQPFKVTLSKKNKKDDYGVVLGCRVFIKEISTPSLAAENSTIKVGDTVLKINNIPVENLSMNDARKQIEKSRDKLQLLVSKPMEGISPKVDAGPTQYSGLKPISFDQLDRPVTPVLTTTYPEADFLPPRPPLPHASVQDPVWFDPVYAAHSDMGIPTDGPGRSYSPTYLAHSDMGIYNRYPDPRPREPPGRRFVSFNKKDSSGVGIRVSGGNKTGIFVAAAAPGSPAHQQMLGEGDLILSINDIDMKNKTREEAVLLLLGLSEHVNLLVQYSRPAYERLMALGGAGDSIYVRVNFDYTGTEHREMSFQRSNVFHVTDTLYGGVVGSYYATRLGPNQEELQKGIIPHKTRAEQLLLATQVNRDHTDTRSNTGTSSFFKRKARRAKSLNRDHWDEIMFGSSNSKIPAYERVVLRHVNFIRPVVVFGPLADVVRERLIIRRPDRYEAPQPEGRREEDGRLKSGIIRMGAIREVMDRRKHCLLDVTPNAVERLQLSRFAPIVVFLRAESKQQVKELRGRWIPDSAKSSRKLYEQGTRLEKHYKHMFTRTVPLTNGDLWFGKVMECIEKTQTEPVWLPEKLPDQMPKDEYLFPMSARLSFASSPESDAEQLPSRDDQAEVASITRRPQRASSDPSLAGEVPYPYPREEFYPPRGDVPDHYPSRADPRLDPRVFSRQELFPPHGVPQRQHSPGVDPRVDPRMMGEHLFPPTRPELGYPQPYPRSVEPYATLGPRSSQQYTGPGYPAGQAHPLMAHRPTYPPPLRPIERSHKSTGDLYRLPPQQPFMAYHVTQVPKEFSVTSEPLVRREQDYISQHPANKHDDSKLQEKYQQSKDVEGQGQDPQGHDPSGQSAAGQSRGYGPYKFTRSRGLPTQSPMTTPDPWRAANQTPHDKTQGLPHQLSSRSYVHLPTHNGHVHTSPSHSLHNGLVNTSSFPSVYNGSNHRQSSEPPSTETSKPSDHYRQPALEGSRHPRGAAPEQQGASREAQRPHADDLESEVTLEGHKVVATARGVFDHNGGILESKETGVSIVIPPGALPFGRQQEIYFKVCQDKSLLPPLDKEKGETLLSPLVMCGPHGLHFLKPVELRLPHCASLDPEGWSFALKSSEDQATGAWHSLGLAGGDQQGGRVGKNSVAVPVDHF